MDSAASILQATSGLVFSSFSLIHLGGHFLSPFSFSLSDTALFATRELYQSPTVEPWLIGASLVIHVSASATRFILRKNKKSPSSFLNWHRMTGLITGIFLLPHMIGARLSPMFFLDPSETVDLTLVTHFLNHHFLLPKIITYTSYSIGTGCALFHTLYGVQKSISLIRKKSVSILPSYKTMLVGCFALAVITVLAIGGLFEEIDDSKFPLWMDIEFKMFNFPLKLIMG